MCYLKMWKSPLDEAKTNIELLENYKWLQMVKSEKSNGYCVYLIFSHRCLISLLRKSGLTVPIFLSTRKTYKNLI